MKFSTKYNVMKHFLFFSEVPTMNYSGVASYSGSYVLMMPRKPKIV
jgi:hypothetical protein